MVRRLHPLPLVISLRVMNIPADDSPNQVTAYPACVNGVTLNSPTASALGVTGNDNESFVASSSLKLEVSVSSMGDNPLVPVVSSIAALSIHRNVFGFRLSCSGDRNFGSADAHVCIKAEKDVNT